MPTFVDVCFVTTKARARIMSMFFEYWEVSLRGTTVVACEYQKGLIFNSTLLESFH